MEEYCIVFKNDLTDCTYDKFENFCKAIADKAFDAGRKNGRDEAMDDFNITKLHQDDPDKETFINDLFKDK